MYDVALAAIDILDALQEALTISGYGSISNNAEGISEMAGLPSFIPDRTDALDAAGNTTSAFGKEFGIGSACPVGLALSGAFLISIEGKAVVFYF